MFDLALLLVGNELMAWQLPKGGVPQALRVQGETRLSVKATSTFIAACADVAAQLHDNGIELAHIQQVHYLADAAGRMLVHDSIGKTGFPAWSSWQLVASEWLGTRFGLGDIPLNGEVSWLQNELLPWLVTADTTSERQRMQQALHTEHQNETQRLAHERLRLQQENELLRAQNNAIQQIDAERLVTFLPALYPRVFTVLGPTDLALLCGRVEPFAIPNPFPEPSEETLRTLQKNFRALPPKFQQQIVGFIAGLPQQRQPQVRPEMRELVHDLTGR